MNIAVCFSPGGHVFIYFIWTSVAHQSHHAILSETVFIFCLISTKLLPLIFLLFSILPLDKMKCTFPQIYMYRLSYLKPFLHFKRYNFIVFHLIKIKCLMKEVFGGITCLNDFQILASMVSSLNLNWPLSTSLLTCTAQLHFGRKLEAFLNVPRWWLAIFVRELCHFAKSLLSCKNWLQGLFSWALNRATAVSVISDYRYKVVRSMVLETGDTIIICSAIWVSLSALYFLV